METALLFDTLKTSKHLQAAGFEQEQAEALTEEFKFVVESNFAKLSTKEQISGLETSLNEKLEQKATKEDIQNVRNEIKDVKDELKEDIQNVRDEIKDVKDELKEDIQNVRDEIKDVKDELKEDIQNVRNEIKDVKDELKEDIQNVRDELKEDIQNVREDVYSLKGEQKLLKWMVGFGISLNLVTLGVVLAFLFSFLPPAK